MTLSIRVLALEHETGEHWLWLGILRRTSRNYKWLVHSPQIQGEQQNPSIDLSTWVARFWRAGARRRWYLGCRKSTLRALTGRSVSSVDYEGRTHPYP